MMEQHQWLVFILLPLVWSISLRQVDSARLLQSQKNALPRYSVLPPMSQTLLLGNTLPNLLNFTLPSPPPPPPSPPPFSFPKFALPPLTAPKFPSIPPFSQPAFSQPPFPQPTFPKFPAWGPSSWSTPSPPPPATPSFPWNNPTPPLPTIPSLPWNTPSPPPPSTPSFPWNNPTPPLPTIPSLPWNTPSPPPPSTPSFPWNNPSPSPPSVTIPTVPIIPSLPWNTPSPPPSTPSFPWLPSPPPPALPTLPWLDPSPAGSTLPPFGLPPGGPILPTGIKFTFSNFTNSWLPDAGVKVTWESVITIELSLQLLVEALVKPVTLIFQQFSGSTGPGSWGWKNGLTDSKFSANVGATCTTAGENGLPEKGIIVVQTPIDNTIDTAITWFTVLFHGWSKDSPFNAALDHTPGTFGGFVTNVANPNLKTFCSHPGSLSRAAAKQGQYVLN